MGVAIGLSVVIHPPNPVDVNDEAFPPAIRDGRLERMMARPHHESLVVWQDAMALVRRIYRLTERFPASEKSGLVATIRRAAISIPARIAEASGTGDAEANLKALDFCRGVVRVLQTHMVLGRQLRMVPRWRVWATDRFLDAYGTRLAAEADTIRAAVAMHRDPTALRTAA